jgi:acetyl esterase/lipase
MTKFVPFLIFMLLPFLAVSQTELPLYNGPVPNSKDVSNEETREVRPDGILVISKVSVPTLTVYQAEKPNGKAIIICPGGGYWILAAGHEGHDVAKEFAKRGVTAFVLKYRLPNGATMVDKSIGPLQDAQRAIQMVRENAEKWNVDPNQIGIMGFSAGGHLASTAGTQFHREVIDNPNKTSLRPDFLVLIYPVITFDPEVGHSGSSKNLIGERPSQGMINLYSNDKQVTAETPPSYLVHSKDDPVKIENTYLFIEALKQHGVPYGTTIYESGGHGYGMVNKTSEVRWMDELEKWMKAL